MWKYVKYVKIPKIVMLSIFSRLRNVIALSILIVPLVFFDTVLAAVIDEETARSYFSQALINAYTGNFGDAYQLSIKALSGRVYVQELPYFWYLRGRLGISTGLVDKSLGDFSTFTQLVKSEEIDNLVSKVQYFRKLDIISPGTFKFGYVNSVSGRQGTADYFQTPTSLTVFGDTMYILDSKNKRLISARGSKILTVKKLSRDYKQVFASRDGSIYLLTDDTLYNDSELELLKDMKTALIAGSDRNGNVYIVDFDRVLVFDPESQKSVAYNLPQSTVCLDAEMTVDKLYILDGVKEQILVYDLSTMGSINTIELPEKIWNFEVTPYGDLIYLGNNKIIAKGQEFEVKGVNFIEYSYPTIFLIKWKGTVVDQYFLKDDKPIFVSIDKMVFDDAYAYAYVRVEDLYGDEIHYIQYALRMSEQDVYVPSDVYSELSDVKTEMLKNCKGELVSYRMTGSKTIGSCPILNKFTGSAASLRNNKRVVFLARWNYMRPIPQGIIKVTAKLSFKDLVYSDAMFYTGQLIGESSLRK